MKTGGDEIELRFNTEEETIIFEDERNTDRIERIEGTK